MYHTKYSSLHLVLFFIVTTRVIVTGAVVTRVIITIVVAELQLMSHS